MVLGNKGTSHNNIMLGRLVQQSSSTQFHASGLPPAKRVKTWEGTDEDLGEDTSRTGSENDTPYSPKRYRDEIPDSEEEDGSSDDEELLPRRPTELESALAPVKTGKEAIAEYETMKAQEVLIPGDLKSRLDQRSWARGKSSIYNDAFNLALETVLEDEGHLFDEKELEVFKQWKELEYEAQYL